MRKSFASPAPTTFEITWNALRVLVSTIGQRPAETGALLCGQEDSGVVSQAYFDTNGENSRAAYSPATAIMNAKLRELNPLGIRLKGFGHSHPVGINQPSGGDELYAASILDAIPDLPFMWMPIIHTVPDTGEFVLRAYVALRGRGSYATVEACDVHVLELPDADSLCVAGVNVVELLRNQNEPMKLLRIGARQRHNKPQVAFVPAAPITPSVMDIPIETPSFAGDSVDQVQSAFEPQVMS